MRIGIITNYSNRNHGSVLQAVALQIVLRKMGCIPEHINWERSPSQRSVFRSFARSLYIRIIGRHLSVSRKLNFEFERFRNQYIQESRLVKHGQLSTVNDSYDAFICGSDQIWAPNQFNPDFFLDFVTNVSKRIAYAPSIGLPAIPDSLSEQYSSLIEARARAAIATLGSMKESRGKVPSLCVTNTWRLVWLTSA